MPIRAEALAWLRANYQAFDESFYTSKLYLAEESRTGAPAWWFEFPETAVTSPTNSHLNLLCHSGGGKPEFRHLRIPISFIAQRRSSLGFREPEGKYSLFLSADLNILFQEVRGSGRIELAGFEVTPG
jgi:hypothetical protein